MVLWTTSHPSFVAVSAIAPQSSSWFRLRPYLARLLSTVDDLAHRSTNYSSHIRQKINEGEFECCGRTRSGVDRKRELQHNVRLDTVLESFNAAPHSEGAKSGPMGSQATRCLVSFCSAYHPTNQLGHGDVVAAE